MDFGASQIAPNSSKNKGTGEEDNAPTPLVVEVKKAEMP